MTVFTQVHGFRWSSPVCGRSLHGWNFRYALKHKVAGGTATNDLHIGRRAFVSGCVNTQACFWFCFCSFVLCSHKHWFLTPLGCFFRSAWFVHGFWWYSLAFRQGKANSIKKQFQGQGLGKHPRAGQTPCQRPTRRSPAASCELGSLFPGL